MILSRPFYHNMNQKHFLEILDQNYLNYEVEELRKKAYTCLF